LCFLRCKDSNAKVQKLDITTGVDFIIETWAYAKEKTDIEVRKCIERYETGGIYVDDKPVCGVICQGFGMLTALYTLEQHRKKGYAKLCMKYAFKEMASSGLIPALTVELFNKPSIAFHAGLGCKIACRIEFVMCSKLKL
jgi:GNAT superfamily N-acetyltransferase